MQAAVGDRIRVLAHTVGAGEQEGEIIEVRGADGRPPYVVRLSDGQEKLMFPGSDAQVESPAT